MLKGDIPFPEGGKTDKIYKIGRLQAEGILIAAMSKNYVIGMDEKIPWRIREQKGLRSLPWARPLY